MDPNFNCSLCPQTARFFCMCVPEKVYLCDQCVFSHLDKGGAHPFAPISAQINTLRDLNEYNQQLKLAHKLSGTLDILTSRLMIEHSQLNEVLNQCYTAQANELYSAYTKANSEIDTRYQGIHSAIEACKQEIKLWGDTGTVAFSADTLSFFEVAHTLQNASLHFISVEAEMAKRVTIVTKDTELPLQDYLKSVLTSWKLQKCECAECNMLRHMIEQKKELQVKHACRKCGSQNDSSNETCGICGYTKISLVSDQSVPVVTQPQPQSSSLPSAPKSSCWTCACGYEYNIDETCQKCSTQKPQITAPQYPVQNFEEQKFSESSPGTRDWICSNCRYEYNMETTCQQCGYGRDGQLRPHDSQEAPAVMQNTGDGSSPVQNGSCWLCGNCKYAYNLDENCLKCQSTGPESFQKRNRQAGLGASSTVRNQQLAAPTYPAQINDALAQQPRNSAQQTTQELVSPFSISIPGLWTCLSCGYQYNQDSDSICGTPACRKPKPLPENQPQRVTWFCPNCSQENSQRAQMCIKCKVKRGWENYLEYKGLELNYNKSMWKCSKCNHFVSVSDATCGDCGHVSKEIEKGLRGEGCKTTFWGRIKSQIS